MKTEVLKNSYNYTLFAVFVKNHVLWHTENG